MLQIRCHFDVTTDIEVLGLGGFETSIYGDVLFWCSVPLPLDTEYQCINHTAKAQQTLNAPTAPHWRIREGKDAGIVVFKQA